MKRKLLMIMAIASLLAGCKNADELQDVVFFTGT